mmetsp:Transcript_21256/g.49295  ORF Transcript_21256/g.49295 Transcript_21256/m.49295 type:complete len:679 (+) Transcript_21256:112-2148(+)
MGQTTSSGSVHDKYFIQKVKLGQGSFGTVWRAKDRQQGHTVAIKQLERASMPKRGVRREDIEREVTMMKACSHENLTKLHDFYEDSQSLYLCLEYCDGGDFGDKVKERGMALQEHEAADWMRQICSAINALHAKSICHRDIKPDNFMVAGDTLKLSDFGLALFLPNGKLLTDKCGTPAFMAPEQHGLPKNSRGYSFPVDMWAAGVSMYMLMFGGRHPFLTSDGKLNDDVLMQGTLDFRENQGNWFGFGAQGPLRFSEKARSLCQSLVTPKTEKRLTAANAIRVQWLQQQGGPPRRAPTQELAGGEALPANAREADIPVPNAQAPNNGNATPIAGRNDNWWGGFGMGMAGAAAAEQATAQGTSQQPPAPAVDQGLLAENQQLKAQMQNLEQMVRSKTRQLEEVAKRWSGAPQGKMVLPKGTPCRYYSAQYGWCPGRADAEYANSDGSFDLDIRKQAAPDKISPAEKVRQEDAWPPGTLVAYHSASNDKWFPSEVEGYNASDFTYNLSVRQHAEVSRMRLRVGDRLPSAPANPNEAASSSGGASGGDPRQDAAATQGLWRGEGYSNSPQTVMEGWSCQVSESEGPDAWWLPAVIEGIDMARSEVAVVLAAPERPRKLRVPQSAVRAPKEASLSWPRNTEVLYYNSRSQWMPAKVFHFNGNGSYDLDVREGADPARIRPAW